MDDHILKNNPPLKIYHCADIISNFITSHLPMQEMRANRAMLYNSSNVYQIRVRPFNKKSNLDVIVNQLSNLFKSKKGKELKITDIQLNDKSVNSRKYPSISFSCYNFNFDIVVALGANKGEEFEQDLLLKMNNLISGVDNSQDALAAFEAIEEIDSSFKISNIVSVSARSGNTHRSKSVTPKEAGKIIADAIIQLEDGTKKYISIKNKKGLSIAQFGISKAFSESLCVNTNSDEWKIWLSPFNLDIYKIENGLHAYRNQVDVEWPDIEYRITPVGKSSEIYKIMERMWGLDYYYLRKNSTKFKAINIDKKYVDNQLLVGLSITQIRYPSKNRKQINIYLESDYMKFKIEVRNPRGKGNIKPTQIQLTITKIKY